MARSYVMHDWDELLPKIKKDLEVLDLRSVAERHGVNYHTLLDYCSRNNIPRPVPRKREKKIHSKDYPKVRKLYNAGFKEDYIAEKFGVTTRQAHVALNHIFAGKARAICWWHDRVSTTDFRCRAGDVLDKVLTDGAVILTNTKRGESVIMTADYFNSLINDRNELKKLKKEQGSN